MKVKASDKEGVQKNSSLFLSCGYEFFKGGAM